MTRAAIRLVAHAAITTVSLIAMLSGCSQRTAGVDAGPGTVLYPLPPAVPRIAYVGSIHDATIMGKRPNRLARFLFGHDVEEIQKITKPFGLAAGNETLLVCDTQQNVVHVLNFKQHRFETMGSTGRGQLLKPVAVAMDDQGNRYVADTFRRQVVVFSPNNEAIRELGHPGDDTFKPVSLAIFQGKLYVLNGARHQIEVWAPDTGKVLQVIGEQGEGPGQMLFPNGIALDDAGQIYVTDTLNCRVQVFAPDGNLVRMFGEPGDRAGEFSRPKHLVVGPEGVIYVADAGFQRVQMFDSEGRILMLFGGSGTEPGSMVLPAGICIDKTLLPFFADRIPPGFDAEYLIFVSDQFSPHKVGIYAFGNSATSKASSPTSPATQPSTLSERPG